jgi:hypothetical protein
MNHLKHLLFICCFLSYSVVLIAQSNLSLTGRLVDTLGSPLPAATIQIKLDTLTVMAVQSDLSGRFTMRFKPTHFDYVLAIHLLGYKTHQQSFKLLKDQKVAEFGDIQLSESSTLLDEIAIIQEVPIRIKGDTIIYNASSFGAYKNDELARLLKLLPGFEEDINGTIKARGRVIERLTVNGEDFYKGDPSKAMQMLRVDMIKTVELIEERSEASRLSGIDDGQRIARVNIKLKPDWREMYFGNVAGSGGTSERYEGAFNGNRFVGANQLGFQWSRSNMNSQGINQSSAHNGLSGSDGFMPSYGAGGISVSNKAGGTAAYRFGQNHWYRLNTHYSFESLTNDVLQNSIIQDQFLEDFAKQSEQLDIKRQVKSHKWNMEQEMKLNKDLSLQIRSNLNVYDVQETTQRNWMALGVNEFSRNSLLQLNQQNRWSPFGTLGTYLTYQIPKIKTQVDFSFVANKSSQEVMGLNQLDQPMGQNSMMIDSGIIQRTNQLAGSDGIQVSMNASYQYSDTPYLQLHFSQSFSRQNQQDRQASLQLNPLTGQYDIHLPQLSNQMDLYTNQWRSSLGAHYSKGKWYWGTGLALVMMQQEGKILHFQPQDQGIQRNSVSLAPNGFINYRISPQAYIQLMSSVNVSQPSINQLVPVLNNSNPMF